MATDTDLRGGASGPSGRLFRWHHGQAERLIGPDCRQKTDFFERQADQVNRARLSDVWRRLYGTELGKGLTRLSPGRRALRCTERLRPR